MRSGGQTHKQHTVQNRSRIRLGTGGGVTHTTPSKYHAEIISLVFIHTKYGEPIVIMVFRCTIQKIL
jgi:hypothetical protein